jgi:hypothetical protein
MSSTQWVTIASLAAVVVSALAITAGLKGVRDQMRIAIFLEYTKRYATIMRGMPYEAREPDSDYKLAKQPKEERHRVLTIFREYLNMCSEEQWLHANHRIDHATWKIWKAGMQDAASFSCFGEAWEELSREYKVYKEFSEFVTGLLDDVPPEAIPHAASKSGTRAGT